MIIKSSRRDLYVYADWREISGPKLMGVLHSERQEKPGHGRAFASIKFRLLKSIFSSIDTDNYVFSARSNIASEMQNYIV
jgi:hypothetical protein